MYMYRCISFYVLEVMGGSISEGRGHDLSKPQDHHTFHVILQGYGGL